MAYNIDLDIPNLNVEVLNDLQTKRVIVRQPYHIINQSHIPILPFAESALTASYAQYASSLMTSGSVSLQSLIVSNSLQVLGQISASAISGSFYGDGSQLTGIATILAVSGSTGSDTINLKTEALIITSSDGTTTEVNGNTITITLPPNIVSSSAQIQLDQISGNTFANQPFTFPSNLTVGGTLTAIQYNIVSSSVIYASGSTKFGDTQDDTHQFTGSVIVNGTLYAPSITGSFQGDGSQLTGLVTDLRISGSTGSDIVSLLSDDLTITGINGITTAITNNTITIDVPDTLNATASIADNVTVIRAGIYETGSDSVIIPTPTGGLIYVTSASYAVTSSYVLTNWNDIINKPTGLVSASDQILDYNIFATTGSNNFVGNQTVTGSFTVSGSSTFINIGPTVLSGSVTTNSGFTGSLHGTSSWSDVAVTSSYALNASVILPNGLVSSSQQIVAVLPSGVYSSSIQLPAGIISSSTQATTWTVATASYVSSVPVTASFATTASYLLPSGYPVGLVSSSTQITAFGFTTLDTGSFATTASNEFDGNQTVSGSVNITNNNVLGDTITSTVNGTPISLNYGITKGDLTNRFTGVKVRNYDWGGGNLAGEVSIWTDSEANDYSTQRVLVDGFGNVIVTGSLTVTGTTNVTGSFYGTSSWAENVMTASYALSATATLPEGVVSSSSQINTGSFSGSFTGTLIGTLSGTIESASYSITASYAETAIAIIPDGVVSSSSQVKDFLPDGTVSSSTQIVNSLPVGTVSASSQVSYLELTNIPSGILSGSDQVDVRNTTGITTLATTGSNTFTGIQSINDTTNSTLYNNGALIVAGGMGITKDVNISGSLNVLGTLTVATMSTQYVTSSQLNVADNKITVQSNDLTRFGGLSVYDSGSTSATASIYWDSLNHKFLYENLSGSGYNSGILIAGPKNTGALGSEVGLTNFRVPVAHGDDHIDSRIESSSIRVDFPSGLTHIEHGLVVTGSINGSFTGSMQLTGPLAGTTLDKLDDVQNYTSSSIIDGYQLAWNSGSQQWQPTAGAVARGTTRLFISANRSNAAAFYFTSIQLTSDTAASPDATTAFMLTSALLSKITVYLRQDAVTSNPTLVQINKNANGIPFGNATSSIASASLTLTKDTIQTYTFSGLTLNQFDSIHIYCDPTSNPGQLYGIVTIE